ncbi:MAG TPA: acyl-CoA dehydrogenase family protein [Actinomycetaceae bacterium]|nr:acyl-CoA dehydrogenase family protein [Actinomycetaceae bacterium]
MSHFLTDEQELLQQSIRLFTTTAVKPRAMAIHTSNDIPVDLVRQLGTMGMVGTLLPEEVGGSGLGYTEAAVICEELAKESPGLSMCFSACMIAPGLLLTHPGLVEKYMPGILAGEVLVQTAMTPPEGSTNHSEWTVFARRDGDEWVLNGTRLYITGNGRGDVALSIGVTDAGEIKMFAVEKGTPGFDNSHVEKKMGLSGQNCGTITYTNCRVPADLEVPFDMTNPDNKLFVGAYALMAAVALGTAEGAHAKTIEYLKRRTRAGQPVASLQAVAHRLAENDTKIELGRALLYDACRLMDEDRMIRKLIHMSKVWICDMAIDVAKDCVQLFGGLGYVEETGIARYMDDAVGTSIGDMTPGLHLQTIAYLMGLPDQQPGA